MSVTNYYSVNGVLLGEKPSGSSRMDYLSDALGSVTATVNNVAQKVNEYRYKPYGTPLAQSGTGSDPLFRWGGQWGYRQTGRKSSDVYVRARHYGTVAGRWTSKDPLGYDEGANLYSYVSGEVTRFLDPSGMQPPVTKPRSTAPAPAPPAPAPPIPRAPNPSCPPPNGLPWFQWSLWQGVKFFGIHAVIAGGVVLACQTGLNEGEDEEDRRRHRDAINDCLTNNPDLKLCSLTPPKSTDWWFIHEDDCEDKAITTTFDVGVNDYYRSQGSPRAGKISRGKARGGRSGDEPVNICPDGKRGMVNKHKTFELYHSKLGRLENDLATVLCCRCCSDYDGKVRFKMGVNKPHKSGT